MHGQKKRRKRSISGAAEIEGYLLEWELISEPQLTADGHKGLCVAVKRAQGAFRGLIIQYPYDRSAFVPQRPKLTAAIVEADVRAAISEGWNPDSRGKPFVFMSPTQLELGKRAAGNSQFS